MILATRGGWLIACQVVRKTSKGAFVTYNHDQFKREHYVGRTDRGRKLFNSVTEAEAWINKNHS